MANKIKVTTIDGVEYVNKFHYDKFEKKKTPKIEKAKVNPYCEKEYFPTDNANVCAIMPIKEIDEDTKTIDTHFGEFLEVEDPEITYYHNNKWNIDCFKVCDNKFSKEYLENMQEIAGVWFNVTPRIFLRKDKKWGFQKDSPGVFVFGNKLAFVLAPRVDND